METVLSGLLQVGFLPLQSLFDVLFPFEVIGWGQRVDSGRKPLVVVCVDGGPDDCLVLFKSPQGLESGPIRT